MSEATVTLPLRLAEAVAAYLRQNPAVALFIELNQVVAPQVLPPAPPTGDLEPIQAG
jgi:hypothetical protein